jgi:hypothetical protein
MRMVALNALMAPQSSGVEVHSSRLRGAPAL